MFLCLTECIGTGWMEVSKLLEEALGLHLCSFANISKIYTSKEELHDYVRSDTYGESFWEEGCPGELEHPRLHMAFVMNSIGESWDYSIETNVSIIPWTYPNIGYTSRIDRGVDESWNNKYLMSGFITMQLMADRFIINKNVSIDKSIENISVQQLCDSIQPLIRLLHHTHVNISTTQTQTQTQTKCQDLVGILVHKFGLSLTPLALPNTYLPNDIRLAEFPTPQYTRREFYAKIENVFALCLVLTFLWPVVSMFCVC